jgi:hypothetical protein
MSTFILYINTRERDGSTSYRRRKLPTGYPMSTFILYINTRERDGSTSYRRRKLPTASRADLLGGRRP